MSCNSSRSVGLLYRVTGTVSASRRVRYCTHFAAAYIVLWPSDLAFVYFPKLKYLWLDNIAVDQAWWTCGMWHSLLHPPLLLFCPISASTILCRTYVYIHISDYIETVRELPLLPNNTTVKLFYTNRERCEVLSGYLSLGCRPGGEWANTWHCTERFAQIVSGAKCWLDIYHWGAGLAVSGRIRDIAQNGLQSSFETEISSSHSYFRIVFPFTFLEETCVRYIIIILCVNYKIYAIIM